MSIESIGELIHDRRIALGMTLEDVGNAVGVTKSTVRKWEKGMIKNMGRDKLAALARVLNINPALLVIPDHEETLEEVVEEISEEEKILFRLARNAKPEAVRAAVAVLKSYEDTNNDF